MLRRISPSTTCPCGRCTSCISDRLVTDLPHPDSPTMPTVLPTGTSNDTPSTLLTVPASVKKYVCRLSNSTAFASSCIFVRYSDSGTFLRLRFFSNSLVIFRFLFVISRDSFLERYPSAFFFAIILILPYRFIFGSNASRRPSPTKLNPKTAIKRQIPAGIHTNQ